MIEYKQLTEYLIPAPPGLMNGRMDIHTWCVCTMKRNVHSLAVSRLLRHPFLIYIYLTTKAN